MLFWRGSVNWYFKLEFTIVSLDADKAFMYCGRAWQFILGLIELFMA